MPQHDSTEIGVRDRLGVHLCDQPFEPPPLLASALGLGGGERANQDGQGDHAGE
jgi:hypothetical protein